MATEVCVDCGRTKLAEPLGTCEQADWHQPLTMTTVPDPGPRQPDTLALVVQQGARLQSVEEELRALYRVLHTLVAAQPHGEVRLPLDALADNPGHNGVVNSWTDPATGELVLQVGP